jgi:uracil-DNA glycosylase
VRQGASSVESALLHAKAANSLEALAEAITAFDHPLKAGARNMVFSRGHRDAPVMLIGEAPGAEEDAKATPFIGRSGQLLDRMLSTIGLGENDVYITNVIPYRPPQNRSPSTEEIAVSRPFFERHIALKKPRVIVAIGGVAASALLKTETGITRLRGKLETVTLSDGLHFPCLPMLHPAFLLRNPSAKRATWLDLVTLRDVLSATS